MVLKEKKKSLLPKIAIPFFNQTRLRRTLWVQIPATPLLVPNLFGYGTKRLMSMV
jgi:hypothetical protein